MKIMIVEDDPTIKEMLGESLIKWGFEIAKVEEFDDILHPPAIY